MDHMQGRPGQPLRLRGGGFLGKAGNLQRHQTIFASGPPPPEANAGVLFLSYWISPLKEGHGVCGKRCYEHGDMVICMTVCLGKAFSMARRMQ